MKTQNFLKLTTGFITTSTTALLMTACTGAGSGDVSVTGPATGSGSTTVEITSVDSKTSSTWNAASGTVYIYNPTTPSANYTFAGTCSRGVDTVRLDIMNAAASAVITADAATATCDLLGTWSATLTLTGAGATGTSYTIRAKAYDTTPAAISGTTNDLLVNVDSTAPSDVTMTGLPSGCSGTAPSNVVCNTATNIISFDTTPNTGQGVIKYTITTSGAGTPSTSSATVLGSSTVVLPTLGSYTITYKSTDQTGNMSTGLAVVINYLATLSSVGWLNPGGGAFVGQSYGGSLSTNNGTYVLEMNSAPFDNSTSDSTLYTMSTGGGVALFANSAAILADTGL